MPVLAFASSSKLRYRDALGAAMSLLALEQRVVFLGQAVAYPGTSMSGTLDGIAPSRRIEMPVAEEMQMGISLGLSIAGFIPVTFYPRWNFLLLAMNQLVNHVDKMEAISHQSWTGQVIVRVGVGSERPLHPGHQHVGDFSYSLKLMTKNMHIVVLREPEEIVPAYSAALVREGPTVLVEYADHYASR